MSGDFGSPGPRPLEGADVLDGALPGVESGAFFRDPPGIDDVRQQRLGRVGGRKWCLLALTGEGGQAENAQPDDAILPASHADRRHSAYPWRAAGADGGGDGSAVPHRLRRAGRGADLHRVPLGGGADPGGGQGGRANVAQPGGAQVRRPNLRPRAGGAGPRRRHGGRGRRHDRRHQHGLPRQEGHRRHVRLGADARARAGGRAGERGSPHAAGPHSGHGQAPGRLGRQPAQRRRVRPPAGGRREPR